MKSHGLNRGSRLAAKGCEGSAIVYGYLQDFRTSLRGLLARPGFSVIPVVTLAVGMTVDITVFGWIDNVLLQPVPGAADARSLVALEFVSTGGEASSSPHPDLRDYQRGCTALSGLTGWHLMEFNIGSDSDNTLAYGEFVAANFFEVLGIRPSLGKVFSIEEDRDIEGAYPYAVVSDRLWRALFHADPSVIGSVVRMNGRRLTIVGVTPPAFRGSMNGFSMDVWVHLSMIHLMGGAGSWQAEDRNARPLALVGRLRPGAAVQQVQAQADTVSRRLAEEYPQTHAGWSMRVVPLWRSNFGVQGVLLSPLAALTGVGLILMLVACANTANLLLTRGVSRQAEFALRLAMGAGPGRLVAQMLTEGMLLAMAGTGLGVLLATSTGDALAGLLPSTDVPLSPIANIPINGRVILFSLVLGAAVALLAAAGPALQVLRSGISGNLRQASRTSTNRAVRRTRRWLVVAEVALSCVALVGAGLFVRSFHRASHARLGFDSRAVIAVKLRLGSAGYSAEEERRFCRTLAQKLQGSPAVRAASYAIELPLLGNSSEVVEIPGYLPRQGESMMIARNNVGPGYFRLLRIRGLAGVEFQEGDDLRGPQVVVVNRAFALRYFGAADPIGRKIKVAQQSGWSTIVGIVEDTALNNPLDPPPPAYYASFQQRFVSGHQNYFLIRPSGSVADAVAAFRTAVGNMTGADGLYQVRMLDKHLADSMFVLRVTAVMISALGLMSLLLATVGLYSVVTYAISERTQEIAVRMVLGASPAQVLQMVMQECLAMAAWGLAIGTVLAIAGARIVAVMLTGIEPADPFAFGAAALFLAMVALLAGLLPAKRATTIQPVDALRCQ